ncbi:ATP-binding protein [Methylobacterium sp. J-048]|uniref:AAA family ATPase n=1 Tax=Methylobacterium sp. J-048 TaxID=2836635 RepID=UPI001FB87DD9|nr:AAA family ATPase [Methylobacterium sp. J-048]MCJ2056664.1 ATP-binding protein [Methylobacterium sp. J-048]
MRLAITSNNDLFLETELSHRSIILAGPNGAGKSTLMNEINLSFSSTQIPSHRATQPPMQHTHSGVFIDGNYIRPILINHQTVQSNYIPFNRSSQQHPINETISTVPDYDSFVAAFEPNEVGRPTSYSITRIRSVLTDKDRAIYASSNPLNVNNLYRAVTVRLYTKELRKLSGAFLNYHMEYAKGKYRGESEHDLLELLGPPPWIEAQRSINDLGIPYEFTIPDINRELPEPNQYLLKRISDGSFVQGDRLSFGEQAALSIYDLVAGDAEGARVYLFDDIDGLLHPPLLRRFLGVVDRTLEAQNSVAIWVTHSPVLVQLCDRSHCFFLDGHGARPETVERAALVERLSDGELVVKENTATIFVEGQDHAFYNEIFRSLTVYKIIKPKRSLRFVSPVTDENSGGSNNFLVNDVVSVLHRNGFGNLFLGLVDHDRGQLPIATGVSRIGRYSIENYWADPLNVYAWLLDQKYDHLPSNLVFESITRGGSHRLLTALSVDQLQAIVRHFSDAVLKVVKEEGADMSSWPEEAADVLIYDGIVLKYPSFMLKCPGKRIIAALRTIDGNLNKGGLRQKFLEGAFWPDDIVSLMTRLSMAQ